MSAFLQARLVDGIKEFSPVRIDARFVAAHEAVKHRDQFGAGKAERHQHLVAQGGEKPVGKFRMSDKAGKASSIFQRGPMSSRQFCNFRTICRGIG